MTSTIRVKGYERRKPERTPDPFQDIIDARIARRRATAEAFARIHSYRDSIDYSAGPNALTAIVGKLRQLVVDWKAVK
ncbi:hypothetical protein [Shinella sp.]|uniref:hypothetical protein n=1 Tax=Shinella sp. TaxID=1870904 RepID=UPI0028AC57F0|nr:hypothetical protein [Shinella sp.]